MINQQSTLKQVQDITAYWQVSKPLLLIFWARQTLAADLLITFLNLQMPKPWQSIYL